MTRTSSFLTAVLLCALSSARAAPVASWRFEAAQREGASFKALAGPGLPAGDTSLINDAAGQSLALNRKSITIADPHTKAANILPTQSFTASMWVAVDEGREWGGLLGAVQDDSDFERGWVLGYNEKTFSFGLKSANSPRMTYLSGRTPFVPGRWHHVAATYDGKAMRLYVDGKLDAQSDAQSGAIQYPDGTPFVLGAYRDGNEDYPMKGRIREAQLELQVLAPAEVAAQFQKQAALTQLPPAPLASPGPGRRKVLLIGTDGTRPDKLEAAAAPNIKALIASGAYSGTAQTRVPTISGPGWSSMLTGVWSDKHGVKGNDFKASNYGQYPDFLTRLEKINPKFNTFAAADWEPVLTRDSNGPLISDAIDIKLAVHGYNAENDQRIATMSSAYLARENVDAAFVYFGELDGIAHAVGPLNPEYARGIERLDKYVGQLVAAVRSRPTYAQEDWLILMSTDHGHVDRGGHGGPSKEETTIFFLANGPSVDKQKLTAPVEIVDIGITAMAHLGVEAEPAWNLDGKVQAHKAG